MFSLSYIGRELRRRLGRTILTALGLAMGVGLVIGIIGVSDGLSDAQNHVLAPLQSVGTDILVTRVIGAPTSTGTTATTSTTTSTSTPGRGGFGGRGGGGAGGNACAAGGGGAGGFFGAGGGGGGGAANNATANQADCDALLSENNNVVTDLSKLGKAGTKFTHDFFLSATYLSFPQTAVSDVSKLPGVTTAVPGLVQLVEHETGTVPNIVASVKTGGQTYTQTSRPTPLTTAERQAFISCLASKGVTIGRRGGGGGGGGGGTGGGTPPTTGPGGGGGGGGGFGGGGGGGGGGFVFGGGNPAFTDCLPARFQEFQAQFTVPLQTINQVVNPPSTDITNTSYTAAGVDTANPNVGLVTAAQVTSGRWFSKDATNEVLLNVAYATQKTLKVDSALTINGTSYKVVGLVKPTLAGNTFDVYFPLPTIQKLATKQNRVTQILVTASSSGQVDKVAAEIRKQLPGAEVVTSKSLADAVTGSLADAKSLSDRLGGALAVIVLIAAFVIAALLTLSSIGKRVREIGTLRAIGWSKGRVVRQLLGETIGIGIIGGALGLLAGFGVSKAVHWLSPQLKATAPTPPGLSNSSLSSFFGQATSAAHTTTVTLSAPIHGSTLLLGLLFALIGGVVAGLVGSWRAARLAPATALRDLG